MVVSLGRCRLVPGATSICKVLVGEGKLTSPRFLGRERKTHLKVEKRRRRCRVSLSPGPSGGISQSQGYWPQVLLLI